MAQSNFIKITITIPVYNSAAYLEPFLISLLELVQEQWEVLCVNNASTDDSLQILRTFSAQNSKVKVVHLPKRKKEQSVRKIAEKAASGNYMVFLDPAELIEVVFSLSGSDHAAFIPVENGDKILFRFLLPEKIRKLMLQFPDFLCFELTLRLLH